NSPKRPDAVNMVKHTRASPAIGARRKPTRRGRSRSASLARRARPTAKDQKGSPGGPLRPIGGKAADIIADPVLQRIKRLLEAGGAQFGDIRLGKILIAVSKLGWGVNKADIRLAAHRCGDRGDEVEKAPCGAGPDIEQPADHGVAHQ